MDEDYFSLQLSVAAHYAGAADVPFGVAIDRCTNLRRRFNLWGSAGGARWKEFLDETNSISNDHAATLSLCMKLHERRPRIKAGQSFGCFSFDPPDAAGVLRIHFVPPKDTSASPLASENVQARMSELRALFSHVKRTEQVVSVRGVSWLYNIDAYKRLFPRSYTASIRAASFPLHLNGSSTWGQVLNWRQAVKPAMREALLARLPTMQIDSPWKIFPYQPLVACSDVDAFYELLD